MQSVEYQLQTKCFQAELNIMYLNVKWEVL